MSVSVFLASVAHIAGGVAIAQMLRKPIQFISDKIIPYEKSGEARATVHRGMINYETQQKMEELRHKNQMELNRQNNLSQARLSRNSTIAAQNFPLNISPFVILGNNGFDVIDGVSQHEIAQKSETTATPLNIFINPLLINSRVQSSGIVTAQVWNRVIQNVESVFINEYGRNGERPVIFYSTAWNPNVRPGTHAAETIYYFLRYIPTLVVEPRYDGKTIHIIVSGWNIGMEQNRMFRQEINIDWDWSMMISTACYERSKNALALLENVTGIASVDVQKQMLAKNVQTYEQLHIADYLNGKKELSELESLGDYSRLFSVDEKDTQILADMVSAYIGMTMSALADVHYLISANVSPKFKTVCNDYFSKIIDNNLIDAYLPLFDSAYKRLCDEYYALQPALLLDKAEFVLDLGALAGSNADKEESAVCDAIISWLESQDVTVPESQKNLMNVIDVMLGSVQYDSLEKRKSLYKFAEMVEKISGNNSAYRMAAKRMQDKLHE